MPVDPRAADHQRRLGGERGGVREGGPSFGSTKGGHRMVRKAALDVETLKALGADRLARLVLEEAERDASFRKIVKAALAATKGPEAVAKLIDRRLAALEKARSVIDWQKERSFRADLAATLA